MLEHLTVLYKDAVGKEFENSEKLELTKVEKASFDFIEEGYYQYFTLVSPNHWSYLIMQCILLV